MPSAPIVVFGTDRAFRVDCNTLVRKAGVVVRVASRQSELAKTLREGGVAAILVDVDQRDMEVVRALAGLVPIMQRAPGESIEEIVARALAGAARAGDQPRANE
jgi:DNA-binding NtrC family response regulator